MKRRNFLKTSALLAGSATLPNLAWSAQSSDAPLGYPLTHRVTDAKAPAVYFVPAVDGGSSGSPLRCAGSKAYRKSRHQNDV